MSNGDQPGWNGEKIYTQHLIDAMDYILEVVETMKPDDALKEIKRYCGKLKEASELYRDEDQQYWQKKQQWQQQHQTQTGRAPRLRPLLVDDAC